MSKNTRFKSKKELTGQLRCKTVPKKLIPNWDDIVDFYSKNKANGEGAENASNLEDNMIIINEDLNIDQEFGVIVTRPQFTRRRKSMSTSDAPTSKKNKGSNGILVSAMSD